MTYAVINNINEEQFQSLKSQGILQDTLSTCRFSLNSQKMVIKWDSGSSPVLGSYTVYCQGAESEILQYMSDNAAEWYIEDPY